MRALAVAVVVITGCAKPPAPATTAPRESAPSAPAAPGDGDIVERAPCPTSPNAATFVAEIETFLRPEMEKAPS